MKTAASILRPEPGTISPTAPASMAYNFLFLLSCIAVVSSSSHAYVYPPLVEGLSFTFYKSTCPDLESIVRSYLKQLFQSDISVASGLLRLHFHDCFVQGCDGSILLDGSFGGPSEKDAPPNLTLRPAAFKAIDELQTLITQACGPVVSCADIAALAARDSVRSTGGPKYKVPLGRRDGLSYATEEDVLSFLPSPTSNVTALIDVFTELDLTIKDLVTLSGAHTIGIAHCSSFEDRLFPTQDSTLDPIFAEKLYLTCPALNSTNTTVIDIRTPNTFDNKYFVDLLHREGLFTSDQGLYDDSRTKPFVIVFALCQRMFFENFVYSMTKMGQLSVLTGSQGDIRRNCSALNSNLSWYAVDGDGHDAYDYPPLADGLSFDFYDATCPFVEHLVRCYLEQAFGNDTGLAAGLLRVHFHDCFVQGCDGSILLDGSAGGPSEKDAPPNLTLRPAAFEAIDELQALLTAACGHVVSCADIAALAARDSVYLSGGPDYEVPLGRRDGLSYATIEAVLSFIPPPTSNVTDLIDLFGKLGLDAYDLVSLSGAHTIGIAHCASFENRLFPAQDPTLDQTFAENLYLTCPVANTSNTTALDVRSPDAFDNNYYVDLLNSQGLFTSDQGLYADARTQPTVTGFAVDQSLFFDKFVYSMTKMGQLSVLTGDQGEIRKNCSAINAGDEFSWSVADGDGGESKLQCLPLMPISKQGWLKPVSRTEQALLPMAASLLLWLLSCVAFLSSSSEAYDYPPLVDGLSFGFYKSTCPSLKSIVRKHLKQAFENDVGLAAGLLRLHFHDCFVQGCDGSILLDGSAGGPSEKDAPPNLTLRPAAFEAINDLQAVIAKACGQVVSCADIAALAARYSVRLVLSISFLLRHLTITTPWLECTKTEPSSCKSQSGGPSYKVPLGRRDGLSFATRNDVLSSLPAPTSNVTDLLDAFGKLDLDADDLVALSGGHTIGIGHCTSFEKRLFPTQDSTLDQTFADNLYLTCPVANTTNTTVLDVRSPDTFDNKYYVDLLNRQGLFTSDQDLYTDSRTQPIVERFAAKQSLFFKKFVFSITKMGQLSVLTGNQGEIRSNCSAINSSNNLLSSSEGGSNAF
ncbi:peroxidase [Musa troglodytarum]|uniref:peroxidase n=1 Tax=Musa troglodytarum TaxID=320322 RepID=A0A9E7JPN3_9LILI|nr:peroxidase [Musa troglodytarum]